MLQEKPEISPKSRELSNKHKQSKPLFLEDAEHY